mgnify:CR=1 FL=1
MEPTIETSPLAAGQDVVINNNPALQTDLGVFRPYLEEEDISEADKEKLLQALWVIAVSFAKLSFSVHPLQQVISPNLTCGQAAKKPSAIRLNPRNLLSSDNEGLGAEFDLVSKQSRKAGK